MVKLVFFCLVSNVAWLLFFMRSTRKFGSDSHVLLRRHFAAYGRAWLLLATYYSTLLVASVLGYGKLASEWPKWNEHPARSFWLHAVAMIVCWGTNYYLRKATEILEPETHRGLDEPESSHPSKLLHGFLKNNLLEAAATFGMNLAGICSLGLVLYGLLVKDFSDSLVVAAYAVQLGISTLLFLRLATTYVLLGASIWWSLPITLYALLQLYYPFRSFQAGAAEFLDLLHFAKVPLLVASLAVVRPIDRFLRQDPGVGTLLRGLGRRLESSALRYRALVQYLSFLLGLLAISGPIAVYRMNWLGLGRFSHLHLIWWVPFCAFAFQAAVYKVRRRLRARFDWDNLAQTSFADHFENLEAPELASGWAASVLRRKGAPATIAPGATPSDLHVVLVHGLFGSRESTWGLLPFHLARADKVHSVTVLSYRHSLWWGASKFARLREEYLEVLGGLVNRAKGPVHVFAHSLGGLLTLDAYTNPDSERLALKTHGVTLVAPPIRGSSTALLTFPFIWAWRLSPGSRFIASAFAKYMRAYPPEGHIVGEELARPSVYFVYGIRDSVAGARPEFAGLPSEPVVAGHSDINFVTSMHGSDLFEKYVRALEITNRTRFLVRLLFSTLFANAKTLGAASFEAGELGGASAKVSRVQQFQTWNTTANRRAEAEESIGLFDWFAEKLPKSHVLEVRTNWGRLQRELDEAARSRALTSVHLARCDGKNIEAWVFSNRFSGGIVLKESPYA